LVRPPLRSSVEFENETFFAEVELRGLGLLTIGEDGLEVLLARLAIGRRVPHQLDGLSRLDALADVEEAELLAVFRHEDLLDRLFRVVVNSEFVLIFGKSGEAHEKKCDNQQGDFLQRMYLFPVLILDRAQGTRFTGPSPGPEGTIFRCSSLRSGLAAGRSGRN